MLALLSGAWEGAELCGRAQVEAKIRVDDDDGLDVIAQGDAPGSWPLPESRSFSSYVEGCVEGCMRG